MNKKKRNLSLLKTDREGLGSSCKSRICPRAAWVEVEQGLPRGPALLGNELVSREPEVVWPRGCGSHLQSTFVTGKPLLVTAIIWHQFPILILCRCKRK